MNKLQLSLCSLFAILLIVAPGTYAAKNENVGEIINMAGKQRMLSQKLAKAYLFLGQGVRVEKARLQLTQAMSEFDSNHRTLKSKVSDKNIQEMLTFIDLSKDEYSQLLKAPYSKENASIVLDLSSVLLEGSEDIVKRLKSLRGIKNTSVVDTAGRQRMLTQQIAKFYIAYQAGFRDYNTVRQLTAAVKSFQEAHQKLITEKINSAKIRAKLLKVGKLWKVVEKFYRNVEQGGLPVIVFVTSDNIMAAMDQVTSLYVATLANKKSN